MNKNSELYIQQIKLSTINKTVAVLVGILIAITIVHVGIGLDEIILSS